MYLLPDAVPCSGKLLSWESCGFFASNIGNASQFYTTFAVIRPDGDRIRYITVDSQRITFDINASQSENYACFNWPVNSGIDVRSGDMILAVIDPCRTESNILVCSFVPVAIDDNSTDPVAYHPPTAARIISNSSLVLRHNIIYYIGQPGMCAII